MIIENVKTALTEKFIKELHLILKNGTSESRKDWFAVGDYKKLPNEVGGMDTAKEQIEGKISIDEAQKRIQSYYEQRTDCTETENVTILQQRSRNAL